MKSNFAFPYKFTLKPLYFLKGGDYPCPVCGTEMKHSYSLVNEGTVGESEEECPNGCYGYQFAYGLTDTFITIRRNSIRFFGSYHDTPEESCARSEAMDTCIRSAQECILEDFWKAFPALPCFQCMNTAKFHYCSDRCARKGTASPIVQSSIS